jgi:hypothetical protein
MEKAMSAAVRFLVRGLAAFVLVCMFADGHRYSCRRSWMALRLDTWSPASWVLRLLRTGDQHLVGRSWQAQASASSFGADGVKGEANEALVREPGPFCWATVLISCLPKAALSSASDV